MPDVPRAQPPFFVQFACFVDQSIVDMRDGSPSLIRMVDAVFPVYEAPDSTAKKRWVFDGTVAVSVKMVNLGDEPLRANLNIRHRTPSGVPGVGVFNRDVEFQPRKSGVSGVVFIPGLAIELGEPGLHWFDVFLDNTPVVQMPLFAVPDDAPTSPPEDGEPTA